MTLNEYQHKRRFDVTSEPSGQAAAKPGHRFVIQKHAARRLHYDFRLEFDGVLKSWAVPHGPSLDPSVKSLAVQVEDHPIDYANFEGTIPKGQYGGGTVMVWDRGTWETDEDVAASLKRGKLSFRLHGEKLQGEWTLVRMRGTGDDNWLLLKKQDEAAISRKKYDILEAAPRSVLTGRDLSQIADNEKPVRQRKGAKPLEKAEARRTAKSSSADGVSAKKSSGKSSRGATKEQAQAIAAHLRKTPVGELPKKFNPQLATLSVNVPAGDDWLHELKLDGYRVLARIERGKVQLITRGGLDWTDRFPSVAEAVGELPLKSGLLDGEVVVLDENGVTDFQRLQNSLAEDNQKSLVYYVFDVPYAEKHDLTDLPLLERKKIVAQIILGHWPKNDGPVRYLDHIAGSGEQVLEQACNYAMEGIVSKKTNSPYVSQRSETWLKIKCVHNQEFVIAGYTKPAKSRIGFGALLLGYYQDKELKYCGRVGTGFTEVSLRDLAQRFEDLKTDKCPYAHPPRRDQQRGVTWLEPKLVAEISYGTRTSDGILRHAVFHGLREDKPAKQVVLEKPMLHPKGDRNGRAASRNGSEEKSSKSSSKSSSSKSSASKKSAGRSVAADELRIEGIAITHPSRMVYPDLKLTKGDVVEYLAGVSKWMLPGIAGRPLTVVRCPGGPGKHCFFQKHVDDDRMPEGIEGITIQEDKKEAIYPVIRDAVGLIALAQLNALEFHPWPARADDLEHPDFMVFDLDPGEGVEWSWVIEGAREVRDLLKKLGLESFVRTSGGKGLHVVAPFNRDSGDWGRLKEFCSLVSHALAERHPDRYVATISKAARRGKVFIDYLRNQRGATSVASYSPRARGQAGVAMPLRWRDLDRLDASDQYTIENALQRVQRLTSDPWEDFFEIDQDLPDPSLADRPAPASSARQAAAPARKPVKKNTKRTKHTKKTKSTR
ncbi:MAG: DNA ligase D [Aureliella sp.]